MKQVGHLGTNLQSRVMHLLSMALRIALIPLLCLNISYEQFVSTTASAAAAHSWPCEVSFVIAHAVELTVLMPGTSG